jgi:uncharacterized protein
MPSPFLTAEWRKLIMANYAVDPRLLTAYLPAGTELDLWNGTCYVSLVGFLFRKVRLRGLPIPFHTTFPEVNLRFYVRQKGPEGWRRGVVFIKEIVPRPAITLVARTLYGEPYQTLPMQYHLRETEKQLEVTYSWRLQNWHSLSVVAENSPTPIAEGSEAEFITEHYWGYTRRSPQRTDAYEVVHPRWEQYAVQGVDVQVDFGLLYGPAFGFLTEARPQSVLLAEGSPIAVLGGSRL